MKFNIKQITIKNFRSIQNQIEFNIREGLFSIEGINLDEPSSTNGCGKSTLVSALYWCLTGNTLTNEILADEVVNISAGKDCRVSVLIETQTDVIKIMRTRKDTEFGNNLFLEINEQNVSCHKIADTQSRLNNIVKIPFELLKNTLLMTSDMSSAFSELTPQARVQTLECIRDYTIWDKIRDFANSDIKQYNKEIQALTLDISSKTGSKNTYSKLLEDMKLELCTLKNTYDVEDLKNRLTELYFKKDELYKKINSVSSELENTGVSLDNQISTEDLNCIKDAANQIKLQIKDLDFNKKEISNELLQIENWFKDNVCPLCHQKIHRTALEINGKQKRKQELISLNSELDLKIIELNKNIEIKRNEWKELNAKYQQFSEKNKQFEQNRFALSNSLAKLNSELSEIKLNISALENEKLNYNSKVSTLSDTISKNQELIDTLLADICELNNKINTFTNKKQLSEYFYKLLGSKGELRPYLLNKDICYLNACMQKYICRFFKNTDVSLELHGPVIDICITSNNIHKTVSSLSGGEKKRLNLAIQLALYDLIKSTAQVEFNILWLDEVESQLDPLGCQQLIEIIEDKSEEIESVYWITNNSMVKENIANKIVCTKKLGKTEVSFL